LPPNLLDLVGVRASYPELDLALDLSVGRGELVSILGPSGSGKTTTLRLIAGFARPTAGAVMLEGVDITRLPPERRQVGFVFQDYTLFPHLDVGDNVAYGLRVRRATAPEVRSAVARYLDLVGLAGFGRRAVGTLSGGEQQRVAIARSLAASPRLLLLDEPFSSLDAVLRKELRRQVSALQKELGITVLFVTHSQEEALAISDRVIVMREGVVMQAGPPDVLYERPASRFVASFVGEASFFDGVVVEAGQTLRIRSVRDLRVQRPERPTAVGDRVCVVVRPERMRFSGPQAENALPVRVAEREYYGHFYAYACGLAVEGERPGRIVFFERDRRAVGDLGHVSFRPEDGVVLPDDAVPAI
jgi:ABC-type Fe3+/spermidine/putrescine transport system ATPase subunit